MISKTGHNLSVLIVTEPDMNWQTFATWYSFYTNLPNASIRLFCHRTSEVPFVYFQWAKRLKIPIIKSKPFSNKKENYPNWLNALKLSQEKGLINQPVLTVKPYVMAIDSLDDEMLIRFEEKTTWVDEDAIYINKKNVEKMIDDYYLDGFSHEINSEKLCVEAKSSNILHPLVCYKKGCGRWIDTAKGCPFSNAGGLINSELTANETRVIKLWKKMVPLYHAVV